jgi:hypothetical protein
MASSANKARVLRKRAKRYGAYHLQAKAPRQPVSPVSVLAFVMVLAAVLWFLAHWY